MTCSPGVVLFANGCWPVDYATSFGHEHGLKIGFAQYESCYSQLCRIMPVAFCPTPPHPTPPPPRTTYHTPHPTHTRRRRAVGLLALLRPREPDC